MNTIIDRELDRLYDVAKRLRHEASLLFQKFVICDELRRDGIMERNKEKIQFYSHFCDEQIREMEQLYYETKEVASLYLLLADVKGGAI